ncbi:MAG: hypothetical protein H7256_02675 [Bdellovibrio sp.]|nr:hypothetical protein [Bdellovibrio sp.]
MANDGTDFTSLKTAVTLAKLATMKPLATTEVNKALIESALQKTPTGGNSKPFLWSWTDNKLEIRHDEKLAEHYLNRNSHTSWIALGCLLQSVEIAAAKQNWLSQVAVHGNAEATIEFKKLNSENQSNENYIQLLNRSTYRGPFKPSSMPVIATDSSQDQDQVVHIKTLNSKDLSAAFKGLLIMADTYLWLQTKATKAFFKEMRFFAERKEARGIRSKDLGVGIMDQIMLYCFSHVPWVLQWIVKTPILNLSFKKASLQNIQNSHFVLITSPSLDPKSLILAGRESLKVWLELEQKGYNVQPYSTASITLVDATAGVLPNDTKPAFRNLFTEKGPQIYREQFHLFAGEMPVWLLRVGKK